MSLNRKPGSPPRKLKAPRKNSVTTQIQLPAHSPFQAILQSRIKGLNELCEAAKHMGHATTIGDLREFYLRGFLRDFLPPGVSVRSGIVCDHVGMCTRQLDFVVTLDSAIPVMRMRDDVSLIPYESALCYVEIKSRIDVETLQQVEEQRKSILTLSPAVEASESKFIFPAMLFGFGDPKTLSSKSMLSWMNNNTDTVACCVLGKYFLRLNGTLNIELKASECSIPHAETLAFMQSFYDGLDALIKLRDHKPLISAYFLKGLKDSDFIQHLRPAEL